MESREIETFLHQLCDIAARETLPRFRARIPVDNKKDGGFDPVTQADRAAEDAIRDHILAHYPDHGIVGEERAPHRPDARYCWVIDPIDGTRAFIAGLPSWGTLIGLTRDGEPVAGVMHQPFTAERYIAAGGGAWLVHGGSREALATSTVSSLADSTIMTTSPFLFGGSEIERFRRVETACRLARYGFDCYAYAMVAAGHIELVVESGLKPFDIVALIPLIEQSGGIVSDWHGGPAGGGGNILACANAEIHRQAIAALA